MSNFNNSFSYGSAGTAATTASTRPQPPPRRRANSMGHQNNQSSAAHLQRPRRSLFVSTAVSTSVLS